MQHEKNQTFRDHRVIDAASGRTSEMHTKVRHVLQHHKLTTHGDGVVEADLIEAVLSSIADFREIPSVQVADVAEDECRVPILLDECSYFTGSLKTIPPCESKPADRFSDTHKLNLKNVMPEKIDPTLALEAVSEPLRSMAFRLRNAQREIEESHPDVAASLSDVREVLARITQVTYDALGIEVPVVQPH